MASPFFRSECFFAVSGCLAFQRLRPTSKKLAASYQSRDTASTELSHTRHRSSFRTRKRIATDENCFPSLERYLPTNIRIPASSGSALINLLGITKRTNDGRPLRISQTANSIIPTDISAPPLLYEFLSPFLTNPCRSKERRAKRQD